jgi:hypothetical protein
MQCPVCKHHKHQGVDLRTSGFDEALITCTVCGSTWAVNHGLTEVVEDTQEHSFLGAVTECVEGDDYCLAV